MSFRRLATHFGVTPMALYRHVAYRDDLLAAMTDLVLAEIRVPEETDVGADQRRASPEDPRMFGIDLVLAGARVLAEQRPARSTTS